MTAIDDRIKMVHTEMGQLAYIMYCRWCGVNDEDIDDRMLHVFCNSRYFNHFLRFSRLIHPDPQMNDVFPFIKMMKEHNICPSIWKNSWGEV